MTRFNNRLAEWAAGVTTGLTLRQVEIRTGISYATVKAILEGRQPNAETIIRFALGFGQSVPDALRLTGYDDIAAAWDTGAAPMLLHESRRQYEPYPEDARAVVRAYVGAPANIKRAIEELLQVRRELENGAGGKGPDE